VFVALKKLLKDRGITYRQLGKHLGCSEAAVKNMIHKRSIDLERLEGICELFGISIFDFMNMAGQHQSADFELSELQEQFFVDNPGHFAFFCSLLFDRLSPAQIARKHHLKPTSTHRYVRDLEKLELIEQRSETQILFRKKGRLVWRKCGPWMRRHFANLARLQADIMTKQAINPGYFLNFGLFSLKPRD
jgi:transcriptional regulator with XRE-family HTH domain